MEDEIMQMSTEYDKPGFRFPPIARSYGFMGDVNTMQALPTCECKSLSSGVATGVGIAVGVGVVAGVTLGILKLFKKQ